MSELCWFEISTSSILFWDRRKGVSGPFDFYLLTVITLFLNQKHITSDVLPGNDINKNSTKMWDVVPKIVF